MKIYSDNFPYSNGALSVVAPAVWGVQSGVFDMRVAGAQVTGGSDGSNANVSYYLQPMDTDEVVASITMTANAGSSTSEIVGLCFGQMPGAQADRVLVFMGYDGANHAVVVRRELLPGAVPDWSNYFFRTNTTGQVLQTIWRLIGGNAYLQVLINGRTVKQSDFVPQDGSPPTPTIYGQTIILAADTPPTGRYPALDGYGNQGTGVANPNLRCGDWSSKDVEVDWISDNTGADIPGCETTYLDSGTPTTNYSTSADFHVNLFAGPSGRANGIIRFQGVSAIPAGSTIVTANIALFMKNASGDDNYQIGCYRNNRPWVLNQATENIYSTGNSWTNPGGFGAGDSALTASDSVVIPTSVPTGQYIHWGSDDVIADVQAWVNGTQNNGWVFIKDGGGSNDGTYRIFSSDSDTDAFRPILMVSYIPPDGAETFLRVQGNRVLRVNSLSQLLKVA